MIRFSGVTCAFASALLACCSLPVVSFAADAPAAGQGGGWFVPRAAHPVAPPPAHVSRPAVRTAAPDPSEGDQPEEEDTSRAPPVLPLPPIPTAPELAKGAPPPTAVVGIISVQDVMRQSLAGQQVEQELGGRRDALARDAQREQAGWRSEQQKLQAAAKNMTSEQIQSREHALQSRVMKAQRDFRERNRIIQEAAQVALGQIERELVQVVQRVAGSHGMNLVLHSEQIALHVDGQDITAEVAGQLNKVLPRVFIPAANEDPEVMAKSGKFPTTASAEQAQQGAAAGQAPASVVRVNNGH
ncbi:OmpH family outer membrane protein [Acetobacter sp. AN02]|uniref:OmpH family outer membrane protein n=1 Tax=Acetobacter sp. AN02 TaxID=2894186 RepID=UPI002434127F|nr:OmpH family outer membrane protein [Acetobacter sp. AN02]MDG6094373.1 OmpH family outer membrane protein [Acetobacter sp. AN02]